jgi:hypothetical protein
LLLFFFASFSIFCLSVSSGETVEVISRDSVSLSADLKNEYLNFARQHDWKESNNSVLKYFAQIPVKHLIEPNYVYCLSAYQHTVDP